MEHLQRTAHKMLEEFFLARRKEIEYQLEYRWINAAGQDISNILRGKIEVLDTFLNMPNIFAEMDKLERQLKEQEEELKKGANK